MAGYNNISTRHIIAGTLFFAVIVTVFFYVLIVPAMSKYQVGATSLEQLADMDLSKDVFCLTSGNMESYRGRLYTPADFENGTPDTGDPEAEYQTCRVVLALEPGVTYGLTGETATYAQRVYVNGVLVDETGTVSDTAQDFVPRTDSYTVYFTPETEETEIIVQHAWYNHRSGGALHRLYLAEQPLITRIVRAQTLCDGLFSGMLLSIGLFFVGMFIVNPKSRAMLWFSLACLCAASHYLIYESKQYLVLLPGLSWYAGHKLEMLSYIGYYVFMILFCYGVLHYNPRKWAALPFYCISGLVGAFYLVMPSTVYTAWMVRLGALMMLCELGAVICLLVNEIRHRKLNSPEDIAVCCILVLVFFESVEEGITYFSHILYLRIYLQVLLALVCAVVLMLEHVKVRRTLAEAELREKHITEENEMLERMNTLKTEVMRNVAHELKTPLTVMSGYAQLTDKQIRKNMVDEGTIENLATIVKESERLSQMVAGLLDVTREALDRGTVTCFAPRDVLEDAAAVCRPILLKRNNWLVIDSGTECPVKANREALLQVLINLTVNAGKHTAGGTVTYRAEAEQGSGMLLFTVSDTGEGIREDMLPHVFERGTSTDGGNGLGLPICRELLEAAGGRIYIKKTGAGGTVICFTVPAGKEEDA